MQDVGKCLLPILSPERSTAIKHLIQKNPWKSNRNKQMKAWKWGLEELGRISSSKQIKQKKVFSFKENDAEKEEKKTHRSAYRHPHRFVICYHVYNICLPRAHQSMALLWPAPVIISWNQMKCKNYEETGSSKLLGSYNLKLVNFPINRVKIAPM